MAVCQTCERPIDPAHAPLARVVGARVVVFCSSQCADGTAAGDRESPPAADPPELLYQPAQVPVEIALAPAAEPAAVGEDVAPAPRLDTAPAGLSVAATTQTELAGPRSRGRGERGLFVAAAGLAAVGVVVIIAAFRDAGIAAAAATSTVSAAAVAPVAPPLPEPAKPAPATRAELRERAVAVLRSHLDSQTRQHKHMAALALGRAGYRRAVDTLEELLVDEASDLRRIELASGLARADRDRGWSVLREELRSRRRDVRLDAATALASLGDDGGRSALHSMLSVRSHKLGAAAVLAQLGDERGVEALRRAAASADEASSLRAWVALGMARVEEAREPLAAVLDEARYKVGAAAALAALADDRAGSALIEQLAFPSLRVDAAAGLAGLGLGERVDLGGLEEGMSANDPREAIGAAEAILILVEGKGE